MAHELVRYFVHKRSFPSVPATSDGEMRHVSCRLRQIALQYTPVDAALWQTVLDLEALPGTQLYTS